jgi:hypothetical protein
VAKATPTADSAPAEVRVNQGATDTPALQPCFTRSGGYIHLTASGDMTLCGARVDLVLRSDDPVGCQRCELRGGMRSSRR